MKFLSILSIALFLFACSQEPKQEKGNKTQNSKPSVEKEEKEPEPEPEPEFPKYETVVQVLQSASDYQKKDGNLKILSSGEEPLHVQVSNWVFEGDAEETITRQIKRDIVYVSFQAFAETDINKLTVTSIPQKFEDKGEYLDRYEKTVTVNRETAKQILKKYLNTTSFQDLYELDSSGQIWLPNDNFGKLKFDKLDAVFNDLAN